VSVLIAPSILSADFAALGEAIAAVERGGADLIHVDVMDGHFVPNITIGPPVVASLKRVASVPLDGPPDDQRSRSLHRGVSRRPVLRTCPCTSKCFRILHRTVHAIRALGVKAGVVLNPATPVGALHEIAADVDFVLVMSVNPGFGGQTFIPRSESKVTEVRALLDRAGNAAPVEIVRRHRHRQRRTRRLGGARMLVAGSAVFHSSDPERATRELKAAAMAALRPPVPR